MNILIIYESIEGQTEKIARFVQEQVRNSGHEAALFNAGDAIAPLSLEGIDKVILAAPVHERRHPREFEVLLAAGKRDLEGIRTLLISVSLSAAFPEGLEEAGEYLTELKMRTDFTPDSELLVAGAVRTGKYDYFASQIVRHVVLRDREADATEEHDFTDWAALSKSVAEFLGENTSA